MINLQSISLVYYSFSATLNFITCLFLAIFVFLRNPKSNLNRTFATFCFSISQWSLFYILWLSTKNLVLADLFMRTCMIGVIFLPVTFTHFVLVLTRTKQKKAVFILNYLSTFIIAATVYTPLYARKGGPISAFPYWLVPGKFFLIHLIHFFINLVYSYLLIFKALKREKGLLREQIRYIILGTVIGFMGGWTNYLYWYRIVSIPPFLNITAAFGVPFIAYAIIRYHLMDINIVLTRAGIFVLAYIFVLGIPLWLGYATKSWFPSTSLAIFLATSGPFLYNFLRRRAEASIQAEERRGRELLKQASEGMMRIRSIKRLVSLMVHVTCKILKLDNAAVFLLDEEERQYKLEAVRLRSKYGCRESLQQDDVLIQRLSALEEPLVYEEIKTQAQNIKDKSSELIREISSQMESLSATLIIPASSRGRLLGFLALGEKKSKRMYSHEDLSVLWVVSNQAALAIENAQFHKKAQEALLREDREMTARFIGHGASHQFGNVLNRIIQRSSGREMDIAELDLNTLSPDELKNMLWQFREDFHAITNAGMQGKEIVSGILSLGAGSPVAFKQEDLKAIIQRSVQTIKLKQSKVNIQHMDALPEILADIPDTLPKVWCNSLQIEQVLDNMLDNALEAIEEKENLIKHGELSNHGVLQGKVLIKAGANAERILLEILDNGIGIKQGNLKNMFTPFFTTKATERLSRKGHGIGMHMVKEILRAHQGKIYVAGTEFGKGTTFRIEFPLEIAESKKL